jgi:hypothetical protein
MRLRTFLEEQGIACETIENEEIRRRAARDGRRPVEQRHHADGSSRHGVSQRGTGATAVQVVNGKAYGPGVADMKAGW